MIIVVYSFIGPFSSTVDPRAIVLGIIEEL